uniref:HAT C-terminal dimerisation domain-containing protein n=1 Tax=Fundulus heteroclitus TaxID=8078 RepID=A0A3Q2NTB9_FUNHE
MLPLNTVDSPSLRAIINTIPTTISPELSLKAALKDVHFVSTAADIWSANNRSCLGLTVHWISESTLERNKVASACRRIRGRHTYDVIGTEIENVHSSYGLLNKVVATVTDNGSNFVKAFQVYQPNEESDDDEEETEEEESTSTDDAVIFSDVAEILSAENQSDGQLCLPPHHRCASHTINIISTNDQNAQLFGSSRSTLASETVEEVSKRKLLVPTSTRWNSFFDAVNRIIEMPMSELNMLCTKLGVKCFKDKEIYYIFQAIHNRFAGVLNDKDALLSPPSVATTSGSQFEMDFFSFEVEPEDDTYSAEKEVMDYLSSAYDLHILHQFSNIKTIFLKYNTPTPSSAPVERLFSIGCLVLTP